ncbi:tetratricopeptide repeat protein [Seonamhaeicola sp.]|uniref:tetratricopeptide repeat protein n=1 Tax=Seonamhaeicola sp. TaxID=1912245 RepID=UPI002630B7F6|nr:tetratricopeptide repeat protein [Seonamhaeicola sp.]
MPKEPKNATYKSLNLSINELISEADSGNQMAQAELSLAYFVGEKVERNLGKALEYLELASSDFVSVNRCFKAARDTRKPEAYFGIAMMWKHGWGVPESPEQYSKNLMKAAELGYPRAQLLLGLDYKMNIFGLKKDLTKSEFWLSRAVESGVNDAHLHLFHLYTDEAKLDNQKAFSHLLKAGDSNDGMAQIYLGRHYLDGSLAALDKIEAAKWFLLAKEHNHWDVNEVDTLRKSFSQYEWNEAVSRVQEWKKGHNQNKL